MKNKIIGLGMVFLGIIITPLVLHYTESLLLGMIISMSLGYIGSGYWRKK